tara:strand:+ start:517 stop:936 length:420 start_codon:yes stop_codon:yes gene_type:complete
MAFGAIRKFPNDTRPRVGIGVDIPFIAGGVFTPNFTTQKAIKNNLINYFLTNPGERPGNPTFGGGLRGFIFEQISNQNLDFLREDIEEKIREQFPNISLIDLQISGIDSDATNNNTIEVQMFYSVDNTDIEDELTLSFN